MQFLYPTFLWALTALAIPVIIHLFYFRRFKKVYFTNVRFLRELKKETSARSRLRNLLILLMRLLAIASLVFAFAQPFIPVEKEIISGNRLVSVFVDNSFSMSQTSEKVPLIDQAKEKAREIVRSYKPTDKFQILTNRSSGGEQFLLSQEDAIKQIDEIQLTPGTRTGGAIERAIIEVRNQDETLVPVAYILSDFQEKQYGDLTLNDTLTQWNLIPLSSIRQNNVAIDSAWFAAPVQLVGQVNQLLVRIRNYSDQTVDNVRLTWQQNGQQKPEGTIDLEGNASVIDTINFQPERGGWQSLQLSITDYPIQFDDTYELAFDVRSNVRVLLIHDGRPDPYLKAAFQAPGYFTLKEEQSARLNYSELSAYDLVILQELETISSGLEKAVKDYMENGGNALFFPKKENGKDRLAAMVSGLGGEAAINVRDGEFEVTRINESSFVFENVYARMSNRLRLPRTKWRLEFGLGSRSNAEWLMRYADGSPFLIRFPAGTGNLFVSAAPVDLNYSDLVQQAEIFVPMLFRMAVSASGSKRPAYTIGRDETIILDIAAPEGDQTLRIGTDPGIIPAFSPRPRGMALFTADGIREAGVFPLTLADSTLALLAYNFDRLESGQDFLGTSALKSAFPGATVWEDVALGSFSREIQERDRGIILWKWLIILALIFLALESLILRLWKP